MTKKRANTGHNKVGGTRGDNSEQRDIRPAVARPLLRPLCDNIPRRDDIEQQHTANFRDHASRRKRWSDTSRNSSISTNNGESSSLSPSSKSRSAKRPYNRAPSPPPSPSASTTSPAANATCSCSSIVYRTGDGERQPPPPLRRTSFLHHDSLIRVETPCFLPADANAAYTDTSETPVATASNKLIAGNGDVDGTYDCILPVYEYDDAANDAVEYAFSDADIDEDQEDQENIPTIYEPVKLALYAATRRVRANVATTRAITTTIKKSTSATILSASVRTGTMNVNRAINCTAATQATTLFRTPTSTAMMKVPPSAIATTTAPFTLTTSIATATPMLPLPAAVPTVDNKAVPEPPATSSSAATAEALAPLAMATIRATSVGKRKTFVGGGTAAVATAPTATATPAMPTGMPPMISAAEATAEESEAAAAAAAARDAMPPPPPPLPPSSCPATSQRTCVRARTRFIASLYDKLTPAPYPHDPLTNEFTPEFLEWANGQFGKWARKCDPVRDCPPPRYYYCGRGKLNGREKLRRSDSSTNNNNNTNNSITTTKHVRFHESTVFRSRRPTTNIPISTTTAYGARRKRNAAGRTLCGMSSSVLNGADDMTTCESRP